MNVYWEEEFERDLTELREELGVEVTPLPVELLSE
jgi:ubiquinone biosynthesis protein Coq4